MKTAMKLTTGILALTMTMAAVAAFGQDTDAIDNARSVAKSLQQKQEIDTNAALDAAGVGNPSKPAPGAPAPAVKPAVIPGSTPAAAAPAPAPQKAAAPAPAPKAAPLAKPASSSSSNNQLQRVNVVQSSDSVRIELVSSGSVTPKVSKLDSPARLLVELPGTADASPQNHIAFGSAGVKGVRIGMDGKNPPTTSVVVDLEKALTYELTPGTAGKMVLTLHTDAVAKSSPAPAAKAPVQAAKAAPAQTVAKNTAPAPVKAETKSAPAAKTTVAATKPAPKAAPVAMKPVVAKKDEPKAAPAAKAAAPVATTTVAATTAAPEAKPEEKKEEKKPEDKKWAMNGKRDPFFSPVVQQNGSGCTTGKKCLEIGAINLRGVVKSDTGFIAVVTNNLNKAYFLRENDPVFNGYVVRITGDSVVFQETVQDKLGKPFTREVVKRIFTPAV